HRSIMAGLNCGLASPLALPVITAGYAAMVTVDDERCRRAIRLLADAGLEAGETGAAALAGLTAVVEEHRDAFPLPSSATVLLLGPWAGLVADRSDKRRLLLIVQTVAMAQSFVLSALAFSGSPPVWSIYAVALVGGITVAFDNPARRAFVVEMVPAEDMNNAVSLNSALMTSSRVVGPALAGALIVSVGFGWCFLIDGLSYLAVLAGLYLMRTEE